MGVVRLEDFRPCIQKDPPGDQALIDGLYRKAAERETYGKEVNGKSYENAEKGLHQAFMSYQMSAQTKFS